MLLHVSPTESLLFSFTRNNQGVSITLSKQVSTDGHIELKEEPVHHESTYEETENQLPATIPPVQHMYLMEEDAELDELETQRPVVHQVVPPVVAPVVPPVKNGRHYNYILRNTRDYKIDLDVLKRFVKCKAGKIVIDAIASTNNFPSTIDEMLDTKPGSSMAVAFRNQLRRLNKLATNSEHSIVHQANDSSMCQRKGPHLICEHGRSVKTRYWIDNRISRDLFSF